MLIGCTPLHTSVGREVELAIYPNFSLKPQAVVSNNTLAAIATLSVLPYVETTPGTYAPISSITGVATTIGAADALVMSQASPSIDPNRPFIIRHLKPNKNYRIFGKAYNASNTLISLDASSYTDVAVTNDNAPGMAQLPVVLTDTPFGASTTVYLTTDGRFDYLKSTLYLVAGNTQVGITQTSRNSPELNFGNLQGNTNYRLVVEAYKLGNVMASNSLDLNIANENAPATASLSLTIPYVVSTLAGNGGTGFANGAGNGAMFNGPYGMAIDSSGNAFLADTSNHRIAKITPAGVVSTFAGNGTSGALDGTGLSATFNMPRGLAIDQQDNLYIADRSNSRIRKITPTGVVTTLAGNGLTGSTDGTGTAATFTNALGVIVDNAGNVYVGDTYGHRIRKITSAGVVTTLAGNGTSGFADGVGSAAMLSYPLNLALDDQNNIYVADRDNHRIRKITAGGSVTTFAGSGSGYADGAASAAMFYTLEGVCRDKNGNFFVADKANNRIRKISPAGQVTTIAGSSATGLADGTGTSALLNWPVFVTVDNRGILYVVEINNHTVRVIQ